MNSEFETIKCLGYNLEFNKPTKHKYYCNQLGLKDVKSDTVHRAIMTVEDRRTYTFNPKTTKEQIFNFIKNKYKEYYKKNLK